MEKGNIVTMLWGLKLSNLKMMSDEKCCGNNLVHPEMVKKKKRKRTFCILGKSLYLISLLDILKFLWLTSIITFRGIHLKIVHELQFVLYGAMF